MVFKSKKTQGHLTETQSTPAVIVILTHAAICFDLPITNKKLPGLLTGEI